MKASGVSLWRWNHRFGDRVEIDFYDVDEWEKNEIGIFDPAKRRDISDEDMRLYKERMEVQLRRAKEWRETALNEMTRGEGDLIPPRVGGTITTRCSSIFGWWISLRLS